MEAISEWFNQPAHADVLLHISTTLQLPPAPSPENEDTQPAKKRRKEDSIDTEPVYAISYHAHAIILSSQSEYFKKRLDAGDAMYKQAAAESANSGIRHVLVETMEEGEVEAMELLLRCMYGQQPAVGASPVVLFKAFKLAYRFMAFGQADVFTSSMAGIPKDAITLELLQLVYGPWHDKEASPALAPFLATCEQALVDMFLNIPAVIISEQLQEQFCSLPHAAVVAWAKSDCLQVHSENCVVFLLSLWIAAKEKCGQSCNEQQLKQLAHEVRVLQLGPAYMLQLVPNLNWFKGLEAKVVLASTWKLHKAAGLDVSDVTLRSYFLPASWLGKPRKAYVEPCCGTLRWQLGAEQLQQLYEGNRVYPPSPIYVNGFMLRVELRTAMAPGGGMHEASRLGAYVHVDAQAMVSVAALSKDHRTLISCKLVIPARSGAPIDKVFKELSVGTAGLGWSDVVVGTSEHTMQQNLQPYLLEGQLHVETTFSCVDQLPRRP